MHKAGSKTLACPVCRATTKIKTGLNQDLPSNFALKSVIEAHQKMVTQAASSSSTSASPLITTTVTTSIAEHKLAIQADLPNSRPIVSTTHLDERFQQLLSCEAHLVSALSHLPQTAMAQQMQIIQQFETLRTAIDAMQAQTLLHLSNLERTVANQLQQELITCAEHKDEVTKLRNGYPGSILHLDVDHWLSAEDMWKTRLAVISQSGLLGAFSAHVAADIPSPKIEYEGHSVDFASLWAVSRDASIATKIQSEPLTPIHFLTHSASGVLRRWDFRNRICIAEFNHPGLRSWSLFENSSKLVAASAKLKVYDTYTGQCLATFDSLSSPAKRVVASGSDLKARALSFHVNQGAAALWDLSQNTRVNWEMDISHWNTNLVTPVAEDSPLLLVPTIAFPFDVLCFNLVKADMEDSMVLQGFPSDVIDVVVFGPKNAPVCAFLCTGGALFVWDWTTRKILKTAQFDTKMQKLSVLQQKDSLGDTKVPTVAAFSHLSGSFCIYHPEEDRIINITHNNSQMLSSSMRSVVIYDDGQKAISGHANGKIHVWNTKTGACLNTIPVGSIAGNLVLCNSGHSIVGGASNGYVNVVDVDTFAVQQLLPSVVDGSGIQVTLL